MSEPQGFAGLDLDRVKDVVGAVWDKRDDITKVLGALPDIFANTSAALQGAAEGIQATSAALRGPQGDSGVAGIAKTAGGALAAVIAEIKGATDMLQGLGEDLKAVPLMDSAGSKVVDGAARFGAISDAIEAVSAQLSELGGLVETAADALVNTAEHLAKGGEALGKFSAK